MAITYFGGDGDVTGGTGTATANDPASTQDDDLYILVGAAQDAVTDAAATWTDPAGFTQLESHYGNFNADHAIYVGYWVKSGATPTLTLSHDGTANNMSCNVAVYRGVDTSTPFDVTYVRASHFDDNIDDAALTAAPAITTNTNNAMVVLIHHWNNNDTADAPPSGYTQNQVTNDFEAASNANVSYSIKTVTTAGTETPGVYTHVGFGGGVDSLSITLALKPAGAAAVSVPGIEVIRNIPGVAF